MEFLKSHWLKIPILIYIVGFVVHNSYLASFGNYEFELVQAQYIISGFGAIAFSSTCFAYTAIKVNLSYIFDTFHIDKLLPWLLRVISLPYVIYGIFYMESYLLKNELLKDGSLVELFSYWAFGIAQYVVWFSIYDLAFRITEGKGWAARFHKSAFKMLSIPMMLATAVVVWHVPDFGDVVQATTFWFIGFIGLGMYQQNTRYGDASDFLDSNAKDNHQNLFTIFLGIIAVFILLWNLIVCYVDTIYPKIPVALGGSKVESIEIYTEDTVVKSLLIQETSNWILYINNESCNVEKIKTKLVDKIIYLGARDKASNKNMPSEKVFAKRSSCL